MPISNPASLSHLALILITGVSLRLGRCSAGSTTGRVGRLKRRETYSGMHGVVPGAGDVHGPAVQLQRSG
ncbi:hypothetical protein RCM87_23240, partial [Escherichia marmotae]|nr:hypothetical protein [Escherichia marmotae]MED9304554.1 hypothetical protein [Escherichia marmotae]